MSQSAKALFRATKPKAPKDARQGALMDVEASTAPVRKQDVRDPLDYDPTPVDATWAFLAAEGDRIRQLGGPVWENAVGGGHIARVLKDDGFDVHCSDIVDRGYPGTVKRGFYEYGPDDAPADIIVTNPPYGEINARDGHGKWWKHTTFLRPRYVAMLLSWDWLAPYTHGFREMKVQHAPTRVYLCCWKIDFRGGGSPPQRNAWCVWDNETRRIEVPEMHFLYRDDPRQQQMI